MLLLLGAALALALLAYLVITLPRSKSNFFQYPHITPHPCSDIASLPIPQYRPFKSKHFVTMGIRKMDWNEWIELDSQFPHYHAIKSARLEARLNDLVITHPGSEYAPSGAEAAKELLYELCEFLSRRYPRIYSVTRKSPRRGDFGWRGQGEIDSIEIVPLSIRYDLRLWEPLKLASLLVQEDFAILVKGFEGLYYCQAGSICLAGSWRLKDKIGLSLDDIHLSGNVPQYKERLEKSMNRFFDKLPASEPVVRNNFTFQITADPSTPLDPLDPEELTWCETSYGPEDDPHSAIPSEEIKSISFDQVMFRTERQTLRRLPRTGAIVFTIKTYLLPARQLGEEVDVPERLAACLRSMSQDVLDYKNAENWISPLLAFLDDRRHATAVTM